MKFVLLFALILWACCSFCHGAVFDPYTRRYNIHNSTFETLFPSTAKTAIQNLVNAAPVIDNTRCKSVYTFATTSTLAQLINFQYELVELCPIVYESIKYTNITTWGPVEEFLQIWYSRFVDVLWKKIQNRTGTCRCVLYDDFITAAQTTTDTVLLQYLQNNYDPSLCVINAETMYKWHLFLQRPQIKSRLTKFLKVGDFSIQLVQAIAKAHLTEDRYNLYFEETAGTYPLFTYMEAIFTSTNWTLTQKGFIKQLRNYYAQQFPPLSVAGRQQLLLMKFSESIDLSYSYFSALNRIPLDSTDGITHFDLLIYLSRKDFLIAKRLLYSSTPTIPCVITTTTTTKKPTTTSTTTKTTPTTTTTKSTTTSSSTTTATTTTTTTTTKAPCSASPNTAAIFLGNGVILNDQWLPRRAPVGTAVNSTNGVWNYFNGTTSSIFNVTERVWAGYWERGNCESPCLCSNSSCYVIQPGNYSTEPPPGYRTINPIINLYPHCNDPCSVPHQCFIAVVVQRFWGDSYTRNTAFLVNPLNLTDKFDLGVLFKPGATLDINDPVFAKITKIGCSGCPVVT